jgi:hypothetical protein
MLKSSHCYRIKAVKSLKIRMHRRQIRFHARDRAQSVPARVHRIHRAGAMGTALSSRTERSRVEAPRCSAIDVARTKGGVLRLRFAPLRMTRLRWLKDSGTLVQVNVVRVGTRLCLSRFSRVTCLG